MVDQSLNFSVSFSLIKMRKIQSFLMIMTRKLSVTSCQLLNFLRRRALCLPMNCTNGSHSSNSMLLKNTSRKKELNICVGVGKIRWFNKKLSASIEKQKAQIWRLSFFIHRKMQVGSDKSTIASHELTCNNSVGFYV